MSKKTDKSATVEKTEFLVAVPWPDKLKVPITKETVMDPTQYFEQFKPTNYRSCDLTLPLDSVVWVNTKTGKAETPEVHPGIIVGYIWDKKEGWQYIIYSAKSTYVTHHSPEFVKEI